MLLKLVFRKKTKWSWFTIKTNDSTVLLIIYRTGVFFLWMLHLWLSSDIYSRWRNLLLSAGSTAVERIFLFFDDGHLNVIFIYMRVLVLMAYGSLCFDVGDDGFLRRRGLKEGCQRFFARKWRQFFLRLSENALFGNVRIYCLTYSEVSGAVLEFR